LHHSLHDDIPDLGELLNAAEYNAYHCGKRSWLIDFELPALPAISGLPSGPNTSPGGFGALVRVTVRKVRVALAESCPWAGVFRAAWRNLALVSAPA